MILRSSRGFTLIEILIVILIISILASVAIPTFLGQRKRTEIKAVVASAKSVEKELTMLLDNFSKKEPLVLSKSDGNPGCFQYPGAGLKNMCSSTYNDLPLSGTYNNIEDIMSLYIVHTNEGLEAKSPFSGIPLLTDNASEGARNGHVLIANISEKAIYVSSWDLSGGMISNTLIGTH